MVNVTLSVPKGLRTVELNPNLFYGGAELENSGSEPVLHFCSYRSQELANRIRFYKAVLNSELISEGERIVEWNVLQRALIAEA